MKNIKQLALGFLHHIWENRDLTIEVSFFIKLASFFIRLMNYQVSEQHSWLLYEASDVFSSLALWLLTFPLLRRPQPWPRRRKRYGRHMFFLDCPPFDPAD